MQVLEIVAKSQADRHSAINAGLLLHSVGGALVARKDYGDVLALLQASARPLRLTFVAPVDGTDRMGAILRSPTKGQASQITDQIRHVLEAKQAAEDLVASLGSRQPSGAVSAVNSVSAEYDRVVARQQAAIEHLRSSHIGLLQSLREMHEEDQALAESLLSDSLQPADILLADAAGALVDTVHKPQQAQAPPNVAGRLVQPPSSAAPVPSVAVAQDPSAEALEFLLAQGFGDSLCARVLQSLQAAEYPPAEWLVELRAMSADGTVSALVDSIRREAAQSGSTA